MKARAISLTPGQKCKWKGFVGTYDCEFVRRVPSEPGRKAINIFLVPKFAGMNSPADKGFVEFTDREVARRITS